MRGDLAALKATRAKRGRSFILVMEQSLREKAKHTMQ
jgi:hypothetical protein